MELARNLPLLVLLSSLCILSAIAQPTASQREKINGKARYNEDLFEGDIKISSKEIETYYDDIDSDEPSTNVSNFKTASRFVLGRSRQHFHG